jgi:hypothetical protein
MGGMSENGLGKPRDSCTGMDKSLYPDECRVCGVAIMGYLCDDCDSVEGWE